MTLDRVVPPELPGDWPQALAARAGRRPVVVARDVGLEYDVRMTKDRSIGRAAADLVLRRRSPFWALRDVNLTVHPGDCVAVIGHNGAGKSTLLQILARLIEPDEGLVWTRGRISTLLNLGVGFDPRLTGRENVELVGALMGLTGAEVRSRLADVFDFAELGSFIDAPLRTYSSGMRARLGFAAATMIDPHILVLDEVVGTGDASFRDKSRARLLDLVARAHAIVAATHDMTWVAEFATYAILLAHGSVVAEGAPGSVGAYYRAISFRPPRRYACEACAGQPLGGYCTACGVLVHATRDGAADSVA